VIAGIGVAEGANSGYGVYVLNELEVAYVTTGVEERRVTIALEPDGSTREGIRVVGGQREMGEDVELGILRCIRCLAFGDDGSADGSQDRATGGVAVGPDVERKHRVVGDGVARGAYGVLPTVRTAASQGAVSREMDGSRAPSPTSSAG
jgi:hypothetical protein